MADRKLPSRLLAEFAAITLGVLVALAIDSAWSIRQDRLDEQVYLAAVLEDLELSASNVGRTVQLAERAHKELDRARHIASLGLAADSAVGFFSGIVSATSFQATPVISRAAVQDLISTGNLRLIQDREVRRAILSTDALAQALVGFVQRAEAEVQSGLEPLVSRYIPPNALRSRIKDDGSREFVTSDVPADRAALSEAARRVQADPALQAELNAEYRRIQSGREATEGLQRRLEESLRNLRESITGGAS